MTACFDCKFKRQNFPCRTKGCFDAQRAAQEYFDQVVRAPSIDDAIDHWSYDCLKELCVEAPDQAWAFIVEMLYLLETPKDAGYFAAGPLEELIAYSGEAVIERVELLARRSPRFRFLLSGVWAEGDTVVWPRIEAARQGGAHIDHDPMPPI